MSIVFAVASVEIAWFACSVEDRVDTAAAAAAVAEMEHTEGKDKWVGRRMAVAEDKH